MELYDIKIVTTEHYERYYVLAPNSDRAIAEALADLMDRYGKGTIESISIDKIEARFLKVEEA